MRFSNAPTRRGRHSRDAALDRIYSAHTLQYLMGPIDIIQFVRCRGLASLCEPNVCLFYVHICGSDVVVSRASRARLPATAVVYLFTIFALSPHRKPANRPTDRPTERPTVVIGARSHRCPARPYVLRVHFGRFLFIWCVRNKATTSVLHFRTASVGDDTTTRSLTA